MFVRALQRHRQGCHECRSGVFSECRSGVFSECRSGVFSECRSGVFSGTRYHRLGAPV
jgi:hypothetical protein